MKYWVTDRRTDSVSSNLLEHTDKDDWPFALWRECMTFAFGEVVAVFHTKEEADKACKALTLLEAILPIVKKLAGK